MKQSEAIRNLCDLLEMNVRYGAADVWIESLQFAIHVMKENEKTCSNCRHVEKDELEYPCCNCAKSLVDKWEPNAKAGRKKGEWIELPDEPYDKCSVCGCYKDSLDNFDFCPYFGSDMRKGVAI